jgi:hypothetical protein
MSKVKRAPGRVRAGDIKLLLVKIREGMILLSSSISSTARNHRYFPRDC